MHASWGRIEDAEGETFRRSLEAALRTDAPLIQIATWNDWGEGTVVEPSEEFGYRDLEVLQELHRRWLDPDCQTTVEDLRLPLRLLLLRRERPRPANERRLDEIAELLAAGKTTRAQTRLAALEALVPEM